MSRKEMKQFLANNGFDFEVDREKGLSTLSGRLGAFSHYFEQGYKTAPVSDFNKEQTFRLLGEKSESDISFRGGTYQNLISDLQGNKNLKPFGAARERLEKSNLGEKIRDTFTDCQPRRTRIKSEYDGEWIESRRYDIAPFDGVKKSMGAGRFMEIIAYSNVLGGSSHKDLDKYGCLVWAISDLVEAHGINVKLTLRYDSRFCCDTDKSRMIENVLVKDAGEYVAPSLIAGACQANFFRRGIFAMKAAQAEAWGKTISSGFGSSIQQEPIRFLEGQLLIGPNVTNASDYAIESILFEALKAA